MLESVQVSTFTYYQVIDRLRSRGYTHIGNHATMFKSQIGPFLSRHSAAKFIPTADESVIVMVSGSGLTYVLEASKGLPAGFCDWMSSKLTQEK